MFGLYKNRDHDILIDYLIAKYVINRGLNIRADTLADNLTRDDIVSKYDHDEDRRLIFEYVNLMVTKARKEQGYKSIEY